jgi:prevent-host-death family protein
MVFAVTLANARTHLGELVNRTRFGGERVILTEHGRPVAALISVDELAELEAACDAAGLVAVASPPSGVTGGIPHEQVIAALDALDVLDAADSCEPAESLSRVDPGPIHGATGPRPPR